MLTRNEMMEALINKFSNEQSSRLQGYIKKIKGLVDLQLEDEYNLIILGKKPKVKKSKYGKKEKFSLSDV